MPTPTSIGRKSGMTSESEAKIPIAVIGSSSMVGSRFCELASADFDLIKADLKGNIPIDITQKDSVDNFFKNYGFEWLILFSAFTDVDEAEKQRGDKNGLCYQINVNGTANVVDACKNYQRKLIFISTDFVFDGFDGPYSEEDQTGGNLDKVSWYGITKIEAEKLVQGLKEFIPSEKTPSFRTKMKRILSEEERTTAFRPWESIILRISYPYRTYFAPKEDFARSILQKYKEGSLYSMFTDQVITPTFIDDLAPSVSVLIRKNVRGIFHLASPKITTPYDFAKFLLETFNKTTLALKRAKLEDSLEKKTATPRPIKGGMIVDKIIKSGFTPTDWQQGIKIIYKQSHGKLI